MTSNIKLLAILITPTILAWLSLGFIFWNWNPETWTEGGRATVVWLSSVLTFLSVVLFGETK